MSVVGLDDGERYVMRGEELGRVVDSVALEGCEVLQIEWPDGGVYLMSTTELAGEIRLRPPNRPPKT